MLQPELIQQLVGMVKDQADTRPTRGVVAKVNQTTIEVRLGAGGSLLRDVSVIGGPQTVSVGDPVYLLYFGDGRVLAAGQGGGGLVPDQESAPSPAAGTHNHDVRYYTRGQVDALLRRKADQGHTHPAPSWINAQGGNIGGFEIGPDNISGAGTVWHSGAGPYIAFGAPAPETFGQAARPGAWLGFDVNTTNDAESSATPSLAPKLSLYKNASNYLEWTGAKLLIKAANFTLDGSGNITASGGAIAGWNIGSSKLTSPGGNLELDSVGALRGNYSAGVRGWQISEAGDAEFANATIRGSLKTMVFEKSLVTAFAGSQIVAKSASTLKADATATASTFQISVAPQAGAAPFASGDRIRLSDGTNTTWATVGSGTQIEDFYVYTATYQNGSNSATYRAGQAVVDYCGSSGGGFLWMTADDADGPFYSVRTTAGSPWSDGVEVARLGNLRNWGDVGANNRYGLALGEYGASKPHLMWDPTNGLRLRTHTTTVLQLDTSGNADITGKLRMPGTGSAIAIGSTPPTSASAGTGIWIDRTGLYGLASNVVQAKFSATDGKITAGAGNLVMDATGLTLAATSSSSDPDSINSVRWGNGFYVGAAVPTGTNYGVMELATGQNATVVVRAKVTNSSKAPLVSLQALDSGASPGQSMLMVRKTSIEADTPFFLVRTASLDAFSSSSAQTWIKSKLYINDNSDANVTTGLVINQGAADDAILTLKSSDVAHGMTALVETDTFARFAKYTPGGDGTLGGLHIGGYSQSKVGFGLGGIYVTDDTGRATTAEAAVTINAHKKSGTSVTAPGTNANLLAVRSNSATRMIVDQEGDIHLDGTAANNVWDDYDDVALLAGLRVNMLPAEHPMREVLAEWTEYAKPVLAQTGVVTYNPDGHHFISLKGFMGLSVDALRQIAARSTALEARIAVLEGAFAHGVS